MEETPDVPSGAALHPLRRFGFRFVITYLVLYNLPFPLNLQPGPWSRWYEAIWEGIGVWVGKVAFGVEASVAPTGSGDTTFAYVQWVCFVVLALVGAGVWSFFDRSRRHEVRVSHWTRAYVRAVLGVALLSYGAFKVIPSQFPANDVMRLMQNFGDASPMGLLWAFMGASVPYNVFAGASEMLGGLLLWSRRTSTLGALVAIAVMANVVMLNFSYDVPVKLYSSHLMLMAVYVAAPDLRRLAGLFLAGERVALAPRVNLFVQRRWHLAGLAFRALVFGAGLVGSLWVSYTSFNQRANYADDSPFPGLWQVADFTLEAVSRPPLVTDRERWRRLRFPTRRNVVVQTMAGRWTYYGAVYDAEAKTFKIRARGQEGFLAEFTCEHEADGGLAFHGTLEGKAVEMRLKPEEIPEFLLTTRGFHWINEFPFNR